MTDLHYLTPERIDLQRQRVVIEGDEFHHLSRVLRKGEGDVIRITDGNGLCADVRIERCGRSSIEGSILHFRRVPRPGTAVTIAMSMLKSHHRFDLFLEKATELGVSRIMPMITSRTVSNPVPEKIDRKLLRWKSVVLAASRQCRRFHVPEILEPVSFHDALRLQGYDCRLIPHESSVKSATIDVVGRKLLFLVGGEGGFAPEEVHLAAEAGFLPVSFGNTVLRAETAGLFAVAMVRAALLEHGNPDQWL
jgi:16S rRNA (uracil1498-N3)-methyltransferase